MAELELYTPTHIEVAELLPLGLKMAASGNFRNVPVDADRAVKAVQWMLTSPNHFVRAARKDDQVVGFMLGHWQYHWFRPTKAANDILLFVMPGDRGRGAGHFLLTQFVDWAWKQDCVRITLANTVGISKSAERAFQRVGGKYVGGLYVITPEDSVACV